MNPLELLKEIAEFKDLILITRKKEIISEIRGKVSVEQGKEWLTIKNEACRCHIRVKSEEIANAKFVESRNNEGREMFAVEFMNVRSELILKVSYPTKSELDASREAFNRLKMKYDGAEVPV